jgi:hypothetical protein
MSKATRGPLAHIPEKISRTERRRLREEILNPKTWERQPLSEDERKQVEREQCVNPYKELQ